MANSTKSSLLWFNLYLLNKNHNQLEKQSRIDSILRMIETKLHTYIDDQSEIIDPIEYADRLLELGNQVITDVLYGRCGKIPVGRNGNKVLTKVRHLELLKISRSVWSSK